MASMRNFPRGVAQESTSAVQRRGGVAQGHGAAARGWRRRGRVARPRGIGVAPPWESSAGEWRRCGRVLWESTCGAAAGECRRRVAPLRESAVGEWRRPHYSIAGSIALRHAHHPA